MTKEIRYKVAFPEEEAVSRQRSARRREDRAGGKTRLDFSHVGVPANDYAEKNRGWRTHYWQPLKRYLEARQL